VRIFFSGIGGSGVSAIAGFMADKGHFVAGSDRLFDLSATHPVRQRLAENGVVLFPQNGQGIDGSFDLAVFSTSVEQSNPDFRKAASLEIPLKTRPEYLADIVQEYKTIAVAGTSGKSTTSGMLAFLMQQLGMAPNFIGGGRVKQFRTLQNSGNYLAGSSDTLIIEACESDGTIVNYKPTYSIILNLDLDHHSIDQTARMFEKLSENTSKGVFVSADDNNLEACNIRDAIGFSLQRKSAYQAKDIIYSPLRTVFKVNGQPYELSLPGEYNLYNALACISLLSELGISAKNIAAVLPEFSGIERRFDIHRNDGRYLVIDDYAHNPHKMKSLMEAVKKISDKVCYIFQPHGYGPTRLMKDGYIDTFAKGLRGTDHLVLLPIYYAGGTAAKDISSENVLAGIKMAGKSAQLIGERLQFFHIPVKWDTYVVLGARDDSLSDFAREIAEKL
ncbi:MAG: murC 1, partial [Nitrospirae bacterium]|nr:murC 1 [Nitrospirota bacterium]